MRPTHGAAAAACAVVFLLAGCGNAPVARSSSSPVAQVSASPTGAASNSPNATPSGVQPTPSASPAQCQTQEPLPGLCVGVIGRVPTHQEYVAMSAAGAPAIEKALGYKDWSVCSNGENCYRVSPEPSGMVGTDAGVLNGGEGQVPGGGGGGGGWGVLYPDPRGGAFLDFACAPNPRVFPRSGDNGAHVVVRGRAD